MNVFKKITAFFVVTATFGLGSLAVSGQTGVPQQEKLLNGMKVLMWNDPKADKVSLRVRVHAGSAFDPQGREGLMQLLADSMFPNEAGREFFAEDLGGSLDVSTNYDYIEISASSSPANFLTMLETVSTAVSNPQIDKETTGRVKAALMKRLETLESDPAYIADAAVASRLFGTFPYGRPQLGTLQTVEKIGFADLIEARQRFLTADNATLALTGNFDRALGFRAIRRYFGSWLKSDRRIPSTFKQPEDPANATLRLESPRSQTVEVRFAFRGAARADKEFAAASIYAAALESRIRSRVPEIHAKDVFVKNKAHILPGLIFIGFSAGSNEVGTGNGKVEANGLVSKALSDPITEAEFATAKRAVQTEWATKDVPTYWLDADTYKIANPAADIRAVESVTIADVRAYADRARTKPLASVIVAAKRPTD